MKTNKHILWFVGIFILLTFLPTSCKQEEDKIVHVSKNINTTTYKIAVVLPLSQNSLYKKRLENTVDWALENMRNAQKYLTQTDDTLAIDLAIEWHDEDKEDLKALATTLSNREDIMLTVGPLRNENVEIMAKAYKKTDSTGYSADGKLDKPLITPCASSEDIVRRYAVTKSGDKAQKPFLWSLCETDVTQSEILLSTAWEEDAESIALLTPDNSYGKTFYEWAPYQAINMNITFDSENNIQYTDDNIAEKAAEAMATATDYLICVVEDSLEVNAILEARKKAVEENNTTVPSLLFSNGALFTSLTKVGELSEYGIEGIAQYADPATGFQLAYKERYGYAPSGLEAQVYDAILLSGLTAFMIKHSQDNDINPNETIRKITSSGTETCLAWNELGLRNLMKMLKNGEYAKIMGASGILRFDSEAYTSLVENTYVHWVYYNDTFFTMDYRTRSGNGHNTASMASWNWVNSEIPKLNNDYSGMEYKPMKDQWALLIQASSGWDNYRHQADVLNIYQMLKKNGWDDDHIILIISDDIANNKNNIYKGEVRSHTNGPDLYKTAKIDYDIDSLNIEDVRNIMLGKKSKHLPKVLNTDDQSNILIFWSGHGENAKGNMPDCFFWKDKKHYFTASNIRKTLLAMEKDHCFRKILMLLEPCHSRNVALQANEITGVLAIASSNGTENSFADYHSAELGVWMSDRFSNNIVNTLTENPKQTYKELYEYLYRHTLGSHVYIENAYWFGNIYTTSPEEFIIYDKK